MSTVQSSRKSLSYEQQKDLLLIETKSKEKIEQKKIEAMFEIEKEKLELERYKLDLIKAGKLSKEARRWSTEGNEDDWHYFDVVTNVRPKFDEKDIDTFFSLFEWVADIRAWPNSARTLLLQCVFTGRAQEVFASLNTQDSENYDCVKSAVLNAYELVPGSI